MSWVYVAVAAVTVGTAAYNADSSRKSAHAQQDALRASQEDDARKTAEAETQAAVAANAQLAETKRRRRTNALALGDPSGSAETLGGSPGTVLSGPGPAPASRNASTPAGTALGAGGAGFGSRPGRVTVPSKPTRATSI